MDSFYAQLMKLLLTQRTATRNRHTVTSEDLYTRFHKLDSLDWNLDSFS